MDWKNRLGMIREKVRLQLHSKLIDNLEKLHNLILKFDSNNNGCLDKDEFIKFLSNLGVFLTTQELRCVYDNYDLNRDGQISYPEFVKFIRQNISEKRLEVVKHAFNFLDVDNKQMLSLDDLIKYYKADQHPRVITRQKTAEQVRQEFADAITKKSKDNNSIMLDEFIEYYYDVNTTLPEEKEQYFIDLVLKTWGITSHESYVSPERLADLEIILYEKIRQKTFTKQDEGKTLARAFKYFDVEEKGVIDYKQFVAALEKFGCVFSEAEVHALFGQFDADKSGKLCYDEICNFFATMGAGTNPNVNPVFELTRRPPYDLIEKLQLILRKRGFFGIRSLSNAFQRIDKNKNNYLNRQDFAWALKECGLFLNATELDKIFRYFDKNYDDKISYSEFVNYIRGQLSQKRRMILEELFQKLDTNQQGQIHLQDLIQSYNPCAQQEQAQRRKKPEDLTRELVQQFKCIKRSQDDVVTLDDFLDYYQDISATIEKEDIFESKVKDSWKV